MAVVTRAIGPAVGMPREVALPFTILGLCWLPVGAVGTVWVGGHTASWMSDSTLVPAASSAINRAPRLESDDIPAR